MRYLETMTRYKEWADHLFLDRVAELPADQLTAAQPIVFGSMIRTLNHLYQMDYVWKCNLLGVPHGLTTRNPKEHPDFATLRQWQFDIDRWYVGFATSLTDQQAEQSVDFTFIGGNAASMSRRDIVAHVVNHTTYHRGHVAAMLYRLDVVPPTTDLPVFLKERRT